MSHFLCHTFSVTVFLSHFFYHTFSVILLSLSLSPFMTYLSLSFSLSRQTRFLDLHSKSLEIQGFTSSHTFSVTFFLSHFLSLSSFMTYLSLSLTFSLSLYLFPSLFLFIFKSMDVLSFFFTEFTSNKIFCALRTYRLLHIYLNPVYVTVRVYALCAPLFSH